MRAFSDDFLEAYLDQAGDAVLQSVGAYQLEGLGAQLFARVDAAITSPSSGCRCCRCSAFLREHGTGDAMTAWRTSHRQDHARRRDRLAGRSFALAAAARLLAAQLRHRRRLRAVRGASERSGAGAARAGGARLPRRQRHGAAQGARARLRRRAVAGAARIGAVNTVVVRRRRPHRRPQHRRLRLHRESAAGPPAGAARPGRRWCSAPAARRAPSWCALLDAGAPEIRLVNRTARRAEALAEARRRPDQGAALGAARATR